MSLRVCPFCGALARSSADLAAHTRASCEQRITARIDAYRRCMDEELERLSALHAVKAQDWQGALS